ncbi:WD40-repeat-containing domain protein [Dipodascopsis tothii]|uniref:WD40-repeat-containing domain protein n=1 Tax=Dipodascopsis tothii TaxID=44089 RepID=UPI0034CD9535
MDALAGQTLRCRSSREYGAEYVYQVAPLGGRKLVAALSDCSIRVINAELSLASTTAVAKAHANQLAGLRVLSESTVVSAGDSTVKVWDLRSAGKAVQTMESDRGMNILSLDAAGTAVAAGTELASADAHVYVWDTRTGKRTAQYVDSHSDDVTAVAFAPPHPKLLLSGATDGLVNVFDTTVADEDDAVHQSINHGASIHSTGFLSPTRIYALSHMETLAVYELASADEDAAEPPPNDLGDVRAAWDCEYVVDIYDGYAAVGSNSDGRLSLFPFVDERPLLDQRVTLAGGHGEEIARSVYLDRQNARVFTAGEDGAVRLWAPDSYTDADEWKESAGKKKKSKKDKRYKPY